MQSDDAGTLAQPAHELRQLRQVPGQIDRIADLMDQQISRPLTEHLIRKALTAMLGITHLNIPHTASLAPSPSRRTTARAAHIARAALASPAPRRAQNVGARSGS